MKKILFLAATVAFLGTAFAQQEQPTQTTKPEKKECCKDKKKDKDCKKKKAEKCSKEKKGHHGEHNEATHS